MKTSFKTTTLIAAIGMSIAVGYSLIVQFINNFTGIDLYVHPIRMHGLWQVDDVIWWASALMFFWGMFRYPNQLPELTKLSKRIAIAVVCSIAILYFDGLFYFSSTDPLWIKITRYTLRFFVASSYVAALWWCYANSAHRKAIAVRSISLVASLICGVVVLYIIACTITWWFKIWCSPICYYRYDTMLVFKSIIYIAAIACAFIGIYPDKTTPITADNKHKQIRRITIAGWILLASFLLNLALLGAIVYHAFLPDWLEVTIALFFFAIPLISGIYQLIACRALQKAYDVIQEQQKQIEQ